MRHQWIAGVLLLSFVWGCSMAQQQQPSQTSHLQIKVLQLERKVKERDRQIEDLKYELDNIQQQAKYSVEEEERQPFVEVQKSESAQPSRSGHYIRIPIDPKTVQAALKNAGYYNGNIDGKIGTQSQKAIVQFQIDHELKNDGIVGKKTWSELKHYLD